MSVALLQGPSEASVKAKPKKQQADVMLRQWILSKPTSAPISHSLPSQASHPTPTSSSVPSPSPSLFPSPALPEEKEQLTPVADLDDDALLVALSRDVNYLTDDIPHPERKAALHRIARSLHAPLSSSSDPLSPSSPPPVHPTTLTTILSLLLKPLLRRLADPVEQCRALASSVLLHLLRHAAFPAFASSVPFLLPTLCYRLQSRDLSPATQPYSAANQHLHYPQLSSSTAEPSEELRLSLLRLASLITDALSAHPSDATLPLFIPDLITLIAQGLTDRVPSIKHLATSLLTSVLHSHPAHLRPSSLVLARLLTPNLLHPHQRVRLVTLDGLRLLVPLGAAEHVRDLAAFREHNVIDLHGFYHGEARVNFLGRLVADDKGEVRGALYAMVGEWMEGMREAADYETLLVPYLLTGLHDRWDANRQRCRRHLQAMAAQYEAAHADDLQDVHVYGAAAEAISRPLLHSLSFFPLADFPFDARPTVGLRLRLRPFVDRLLPVLMVELRDWQGGVRRDSLLLLRTMLFLLEEVVGGEWFREVTEVGLRVGGGEGWGEVMALVGRYGGEEVMREVRRAREDGRGDAVLDAVQWMVRAMPPILVVRRAEEFERWMADDRSSASLGIADMWRQQRVYEQLARVVYPVDSAEVMRTSIRHGLSALRDAVASRAGNTSDAKALLQAVDATLSSLAEHII